MKWEYTTHAVVIGLYALLALVMSWPLAVHLDEFVVGSGGDPWQTMWRFDHKLDLWQEAAVDGSLPAFWKREFFGGGEARLVNLSVWPWMFARLMFQQPLAYNLVWLASFVLSGYAMYLLARWLIKHERSSMAIRRPADKLLDPSSDSEDASRSAIVEEAAPFLAGLVYLFLPFHVAHSYGHFGALQTQWLPLLMLTLLTLVRRPTWWKAATLLALLVVQAWSEHHYALWFGLFSVVWLLFEGRRVRGSILKGKRAGAALIVGAAALLLVSVPYLPTIRLAAQPESRLELGVEQTTRFSADLFSYVVPASFHPIWGGLSHALFGQHFTGNVSEATQYLGIAPLLLVLFFHRAIPRKQKGFWLTVAGVFALISLGPWLHVVGRVLPVPLPYLLLDDLPVFSSVRTVARAGVMVGLAWVILLGWVLRAHIKRIISVEALIGVVLLEFLFVPVPLQRVAISEAYETAAREPGAGVIEIPAATNYQAASKALYASRVHDKEIIGNIALERALGDAELREYRSLPALRQLLYLRTGHILEGRDEFFAQDMGETLADALRWLDVRLIIVHPDSLSAVQLEAVERLLQDTMQLEVEIIDDVRLYRVPGDLRGDGVFMARDDGWDNVGFDPVRDSVFAEVPERAHLVLYNVTDRPQPVSLRYTVPPESMGRLHLGAAIEIEDSFDEAQRERTLRLTIDPGATTLSFVREGDGPAVIQNPVLGAL